MKPIIAIVALILTLALLPSCTLLSGEAIRKKAYQEGFRDGGANEAKRAYWTGRSDELVPVPSVEITEVPEHTTEDGVIIEPHQTQTQTLPQIP